MIRAYSAVTELFLNSLQASQTRSATASQQISSGYRVNQASDSPGDVISIMDLQTRVSHASQVLKNLTGAQAEASSADKALQTAINMMDQIDVIATQALGISNTTDTRSSLAVQVKQLTQQMVGLSQLNVDGRYVFSGDTDQQAQYDYNETTNTAVWKVGSKQTYQVLDIFGESFKPALTATDIFDNRTVPDPANPDPSTPGTATDENVFAALQTLYAGLTDSNLTTGTATITSAISKIQSSQTWLNNCLSFYGSVENRLTQSETMATQYQTMWTTQLGTARDTDVASAATELTAAKTQQEAAMAAYTSLSRQTLFDYIK
jgi:flagellar hook-associated protein 3 FlgL